MAGSSIFGPAGTMAAASSMSVWISPGTASAVARSRVSFTTMRPIGLSSRTTSPRSVIQDVETSPPNCIRTLKAGTGRPAARTISRACTSSDIGALRSVAGSKTASSRCCPVASPSAARRRERFSESAGGSGRSRLSVRLPDGVSTVRSSRRPSLPSAPFTDTAPVPGSSEKAKECSAKALSTRAEVWMRAALVAPRSAIWSWPSSCSSKPSLVVTVWPTMKPIFSPR